MIASRTCIAAGVKGLVALALAASGAAAAEFHGFKGKTITMIVGAEAGGGTDAVARLFAPYLRKYLPGEPNIVVHNMPGASGITSLNYFAQRTPPDGLTVMMGSISTVDPVVYRNSSAQYDPRLFRIVGGIGRGGFVTFITREAESRLFDKSLKPAMIGSVMAVPRPAMQPALWAIEYLGWNAAWVTGYHGTNDTMLAFDRGEIDITSTGNIFAIQDRLNSGKLRVIFQTGMVEGGKIVGRAEFGQTPLFSDLMQGKVQEPNAKKAFDYLMALNTGDKWIGLAPGTPDSIVDAYHDAFVKTASEREFLERGEKISEGFVPMVRRDVQTVVRTLADTPAEAVDYTKWLMRKQGMRVQ